MRAGLHGYYCLSCEDCGTDPGWKSRARPHGQASLWCTAASHTDRDSKPSPRSWEAQSPEALLPTGAFRLQHVIEPNEATSLLQQSFFPWHRYGRWWLWESGKIFHLPYDCFGQVPILSLYCSSHHYAMLSQRGPHQMQAKNVHRCQHFHCLPVRGFVPTVSLIHRSSHRLSQVPTFITLKLQALG